MKKTILFAIALFAVGCSNEKAPDPAKSADTLVVVQKPAPTAPMSPNTTTTTTTSNQTPAQKKDALDKANDALDNANKAVTKSGEVVDKAAALKKKSEDLLNKPR